MAAVDQPKAGFDVVANENLLGLGVKGGKVDTEVGVGVLVASWFTLFEAATEFLEGGLGT